MLLTITFNQGVRDVRVLSLLHHISLHYLKPFTHQFAYLSLNAGALVFCTLLAYFVPLLKLTRLLACLPG